MKKVVKILLLLLSCVLFTSCSCIEPVNFSLFPQDRSYKSPHKNDILVNYWGPSYGYEQTIDGFRVCLRTDGYYQIVGLTQNVGEDKVLIIPSSINGIPVMGVGANIVINHSPYNFEVSIDWYYDNFAEGNFVIPLEYESTDSYYEYGPTQQKELMFYERDKKLGLNFKKVYIDAHHVNIPIAELVGDSNAAITFDNENKFRMLVSTIAISNCADNYYYSRIKDYIDLENLSYDEKIKSIDYLLRCLCRGSQVISRERLYEHWEYPVVYNHFEYLNKKSLYDRLAELRFNLDLEEAIRRFESQETESKYIPFVGDYDDPNIREKYYNVYYDGYIYNPNYPYNFHTPRFHFFDMCANVEFHYNLKMDGQNYHDSKHPYNDIYWIDYLANGGKLMVPPTPHVEGYTFLGWYKDKDCTIPYNFETDRVYEVENEYVWLNLYGKWIESL